MKKVVLNETTALNTKIYTNRTMFELQIFLWDKDVFLTTKLIKSHSKF